jgi:hypothetical protein
MNQAPQTPQVETVLDQDPVRSLAEELTDTQKRLKAAIVQPLEERMEQIEKRVVDAIRNDRKSVMKSFQSAMNSFFGEFWKRSE